MKHCLLLTRSRLTDKAAVLSRNRRCSSLRQTLFRSTAIAVSCVCLSSDSVHSDAQNCIQSVANMLLTAVAALRCAFIWCSFRHSLQHITKLAGVLQAHKSVLMSCPCYVYLLVLLTSRKEASACPAEVLLRVHCAVRFVILCYQGALCRLCTWSCLLLRLSMSSRCLVLYLAVGRSLVC